MEDLHNEGWVHRDIRKENVMIDRRSEEFKLIDFDFAVKKNSQVTFRLRAFPDGLQRGQTYTELHDMYMLGALIEDFCKSFRICDSKLNYLVDELKHQKMNTKECLDHLKNLNE